MKSKKMREFKERMRQNAENFKGQEEKSKLDLCYEFFNKLAELLKDQYEVVPSSIKDLSRYLVPKGTAGEITYHGKPELSFRVSDHWSWYSNLEKCPDEKYIQCYSMDMPVPRPRVNPGEGTNAIRGYQVCIQQNGRYHHVYGDKFDRKTHRWGWVEVSPEIVVRELGLKKSA